MEMPDLGTMRTAEGGSVAFGGMKYTAYARKEEPVSKMKPQLTVVKGSGISVRINKPAKFEEVKNIADDLLGKNVVIVNYELVDSNEQRRINDFVNGVCYVTDGHVEQISDRIVLYTPEGIDAEAAFLKYARFDFTCFSSSPCPIHKNLKLTSHFFNSATSFNMKYGFFW